MAVVADADVQERRSPLAVLAGLAEVQVQLDGQLRVLAPVAEDLLADRGRRALQGGLADLVLGLDEVVGGHPGQPQQGQRGPLPRLEGVLGGGLEPRDRHPPGQRAVAVEVQQPGQPGAEQGGQVAGHLLVADQQALAARVVALHGQLLGHRGRRARAAGRPPPGRRRRARRWPRSGWSRRSGPGPGRAAGGGSRAARRTPGPARRAGWPGAGPPGRRSCRSRSCPPGRSRPARNGRSPNSRCSGISELPPFSGSRSHSELEATGNVVEISRYVPIAGWAPVRIQGPGTFA